MEKPDTICPIMQVIGEIRGGGLYIDDDDKAPMVIIGGNNYACDETSYYIMSRKIALARFKLGRPNIVLITRAREFMYSFESLTYGEILSQLPPFIVIVGRTQAIVDDIIDLVYKLDFNIVNYVYKMALTETAVPLSIKCGELNNDCSNCGELFNTINAIINHVNALDMSANIIMPNKMAPLSAMIGDFDTNTKAISSLTGMNALDELASHETAICNRCMDIEKYYASGINKLGEVMTTCEDIINKLNTVNTVNIISI